MNLTLFAAVRLMPHQHYVYRIGSRTNPPSGFVKNAVCIELRILEDGAHTGALKKNSLLIYRNGPLAVFSSAAKPSAFA